MMSQICMRMNRNNYPQLFYLREQKTARCKSGFFIDCKCDFYASRPSALSSERCSAEMPELWKNRRKSPPPEVGGK
jgi:hypothetical protein